MKKLFSSLMLACISIFSCMGQSFSSGGLNFEIVSAENRTVAVTGVSGQSPESLVIPASVTNEGVDYTVEAVGDWSFLENETITNLTIEEGVAKIGDGAFYLCTSLNLVALPESLKSIGRSSFSSCAFTAITIPDNVTSIDSDTFSDCAALKTVVWGKGLDIIPESCFYNCGKLKTVKLSDGLETISTNSFYGCSSLESLSLPASLTEIKENAFFNCEALKTLTVANGNPLFKDIDGVVFDKEGTTLICFPPANSLSYTVPDGTLEISPYAFCTSVIESLTISPSVEKIGDKAFMNCRKVKEIKVGNKWQGSALTTIGEYTFAFCAELETIHFYGQKIESFGASPFESSLAIKEIYIHTLTPPVITDYQYGIGGNGKETRLYVPQASVEAYSEANGWKGFSVVGDPAQPVVFENDIYTFTVTSEDEMTVSVTGVNTEGQNTLKIPATANLADKEYSVTEIGPDLLFSNGNIKEINIPESVKKICDNAFCESILERITLSEGLDSIGAGAFCYTPIEEIILPSTVRYIGGSAFADCAKLKRIVISDKVETLGSCMFYGCSALEEVVLGSGLKSLDSASFYECVSLKSIELPEGFTTIMGNVFYGCLSLENIKLPSTIEAVTGIAFANCPALSTITVAPGCADYKDIDGVLYNYDGSVIVRYPAAKGTTYEVVDGVTQIGEHAFSYCTELSSVKLPTSITNIYGYAFYGCSTLPSIELPEGLLYIFDGALQNCSSLEEVRYPDSLREIGYWGLAENPSLKRIYMGSQLHFICDYLLEGSDNVEEIHITATVPPEAMNFYAMGNNYSSINLYVPTESISAYKSVSPWKYCNVLSESSNVADPNISTDGKLEIYDIRGIQQNEGSKLSNGLYIINGRKVLIKQ